jgi:two-component system, sensor histidine kinase PdtaS
LRAGLRNLIAASSLGVRLGSTLILALLPLGVLSVVQSRWAQEQADISTLEGVGGASLQAVQAQIDLIEDAQISARVLAGVLSFALDEGGQCIGRVKSVARGIPEATLVGYIPMSGLLTCASNDAVYDFSKNALFQRMVARPVPSVEYNPHGPVSGTAVVGVGHPVFDQSGAQIGIAVISLPYVSVAPKDYSDPVGLWRPIYLATIMGDGTLLISSDPARDLRAILPKGIAASALASRAGAPTFEDDPAHGRRILSVTSVARDLFLVSLWEQKYDGLFSPASAVAPYLVPALTWIAALVVAAFASARLVVRHVRALSRSMSDYMTRRAPFAAPDMSSAPVEIQKFHAVYEELIRTIEQEEAELQNLLVDKDLLLREVNHRSGNSLQIIASVMRMYRREAKDPELRSVLDGLINRVIALSSTHTSLYTLSGQRDVPMDEVLGNVIRRLKEIHGIALGVARKEFQPIRMEAQVAVPLALALAEIVSSIFESRVVEQEAVQISLTEEDGFIRLSVAGPHVPDLSEGLVSLPRKMLQQYATQLRGKLSIRTDADRSIVDLVFPR